MRDEYADRSEFNRIEYGMTDADYVPMCFGRICDENCTHQKESES